MSVVVVVEFTAKDGQLDNLLEALHKILPDTKAYQEAYMAWRMGNGDHDKWVQPHLEGFGITYADVKHTY